MTASMPMRFLFPDTIPFLISVSLSDVIVTAFSYFSHTKLHTLSSFSSKNYFYLCLVYKTLHYCLQLHKKVKLHLTLLSFPNHVKHQRWATRLTNKLSGVRLNLHSSVLNQSVTMPTPKISYCASQLQVLSQSRTFHLWQFSIYSPNFQLLHAYIHTIPHHKSSSASIWNAKLCTILFKNTEICTAHDHCLIQTWSNDPWWVMPDQMTRCI